MKIKITEAQAKRLKLIKENSNIIEQFEMLCKNKSEELNKIFFNITNFSILEILEPEFNSEQIYSNVSEIERTINAMEDKLISFSETLPEDQIKKIDSLITNYTSSLFNKINSIHLILMELEKVHELSIEHKPLSLFPNNKPIDISNIQK